LKNWLFAIRAPKLSSLFFVPATLSVALNSNYCSATPLSSPGSSKDQASVFIATAEPERGSAGGGTRLIAKEPGADGEIDVNGIVVSNPNPKQGEPLKVTLVNADASDSVTFNGETYKLYPDEVDGKAVKTALVGIHPQLKPGKYQFVAGSAVATVTVHDGGFGIQRLTLPKKKDNFIASPGEKETMARAKKTLSDTKRWSGVFKRPATGRMSTRFGVKRIVNGKLLTDYFHSGLDFAAPAGTPIHAAAPGKVIVAHTGWRLHGNVVAIDHGRGVISIGIHMTKVLVKEGDEVETGQVVGTVGQTGRASGPHLHYGIYVNDIATNPEFWFRNQY